MKSNRNYVIPYVHPAFKYFGGKRNLCRAILQVSPPHRIYVEPFAGALNVLLNKYREDVEVAGDVSPELILFYRVLVDHYEALIERVMAIKFEQATSIAAYAAKNPGDDLDDLTRAANFLCRQRMGFSGESSGWAYTPSKEAAWKNLPSVLRKVADRLTGVDIVERSAFDLIPEYDSPETFYYVDPPYYRSTRSGGGYLHEPSGFDHVRLLRMLKSLKGDVILSGYAVPAYDDELTGWERVKFPALNNASLVRGVKRSKRTEVLWVKPAKIWKW